MTTLLVSTNGDDSDGLTWATAYQTITKGFQNLSGVTDDIMDIDDEPHVQTTNLQTSSSAKTGGSISIESRSGNPVNSSINGDTVTGNFYLWRNNETGNVNGGLKNITLKDHKRTDALPSIFNSNESVFDVDNVVVENITQAGSTGALNGIMRVDGGVATPVNMKNISFLNNSLDMSLSTVGNEGLCFSSRRFGTAPAVFENITVDGLTVTSGDLYQLNGVWFFRGPSTYNGDNVFKNINLSGNHGSYGVLKFESLDANYTYAFNGTMLLDNITQTYTGPVQGASDGAFGLVNVSVSDLLLINGAMTIRNNTTTVDSGRVDNGCISNLHST